MMVSTYMKKERRGSGVWSLPRQLGKSCHRASHWSSCTHLNGIAADFSSSVRPGCTARRRQNGSRQTSWREHTVQRSCRLERSLTIEDAFDACSRRYWRGPSLHWQSLYRLGGSLVDHSRLCHRGFDRHLQRSWCKVWLLPWGGFYR